MGTVTDFRPMDKPAHPLKTIVLTPLAIGLMDTPPLHPEPEFHPVTPQFDPPTQEQLERLDGIEALTLLVALHGAATVQRWLVNLAAMQGQDLDRPADRCLADGAALINSICVRCGRDNS